MPKPSIIWDARDPLGASGITSHAFTATGSTEAIGAPFCPSGDFSGVRERDGRCMEARRFDGVNDWYTGAIAATADPADGDFTACVFFRQSATAATVYLADKRDLDDNSGWGIYISNTGVCGGMVDNGPSAVVPWGQTIAVGSWGTCCLTIDRDGLSSIYVNGKIAGDTAATPAGGSISSSQALLVGKSAVAANMLTGDVTALLTWASLLSAAQVKTWHQAVVGLLGSRGETATYSNTGPVSAWVDGQIETFSDDFAILGAQIPPGLTGGGTTARGVLSHPGVTNSLLQSRALDTTWSAGGVGTITCGQANTPFADGRTTCKLVDDNAAAWEVVGQTIDIAAQNTGDKDVLCVYAAADSAQTLGITLSEAAGAGCVQTNTNLDLSVTTSWSLLTYPVTVADGVNCTTMTANIAPHAIADGPAGVGAVYLVAQFIKGTDKCPSIYCETAAAGVTCGADKLSYALAQPVVSATGALVGITRVTMDWTPFTDDVATATACDTWTLFKDNADNTTSRWQDNQTLVVYSNSASVLSTQILSGVQTLVPGGVMRISQSLNFDGDRYQQTIDGQLAGTGTAAASSPSGLTTLFVGVTPSGSYQMTGGGATANVRISK